MDHYGSYKCEMTNDFTCGMKAPRAPREPLSLYGRRIPVHDPFLNKKMSDEMRENYGELGEDLYTFMVGAISEGRGWNEKH